MKKIFDEVGSLDKKCYEKFLLSEDILMEHAALALKKEIKKKIKKFNNTILIVCGVGNNGADGITLSRLLQHKYKNILLYIPFELKSEMAKIQLKRVNLLGIKAIKNFSSISGLKIDLIVDCLFGSGLNKPLNKKSQKIITYLNKINCYKISCDIPSGVNNKGVIEKVAFKACTTVTMGALKVSLFTDMTKDYVGKLKIGNLGLRNKMYENKSNMFLLQYKDLVLPFRKKHDSHKGTYGHACVIVGNKKGAAILASDAAFSFGAGLVTAIIHEKIEIPHHIMTSDKIPNNTTAIALGMGLGAYNKKELKNILNTKVKKIIDADLFYEEILLDYLDNEIVLTPHSKEFCFLLKMTKIDNICVEELQKNRFFYVKKFCKKYPKVVLLLKGANVIISQNNKLYVNTFGTPTLSKGGSGDVLSGLIVSLLAQGYSSLQGAINASLAHTLSLKNYMKNNYSLKPKDLIKGIKSL